MFLSPSVSCLNRSSVSRSTFSFPNRAYMPKVLHFFIVHGGMTPPHIISMHSSSFTVPLPSLS